ncbi:MAG: hypothetical protein JGK30_04530 [Microcoleus sp. PH2017_40_RAT_O_B]|uniref:hypothetical protein n=1 Tax=unclassified Microcoleus TaxID=2642155 RepID=UPI001D959803|nr:MULTISPECIES: hypothetical protein [unclassified Microcoleus]MCC3434986.1 hypothetical protein [Microcoleus sp. PH2017_05_CCC_O_A]MCC3571174.1 hypothetical protein [Microcoleus sp. PH2017_34_RAT_O_A]MCC3585267.1 hypothetical protein [Microcoleus sp. PH2017_30_WIL_O_A]MCC3608788.1 hypothetical protein [Microcoleus sp. PH2017_40_RAT_O_B]
MKAQPNMTPAKPKSPKMIRKNTSPQPPSPFEKVFAIVVCITLLSGGVSLSLSMEDRLSPQQIRIFETCKDTWNMGVGAIFGLLGSKADDDE